MRNKTLLRVVNALGFTLAVTLFPSAQALQIKVTVPDCPSGQSLIFSSADNSLVCSGSTPVSNTPSNCVVTAVPPSSSGNGVSAGTQVSLTASCTTGSTPITYSWNIGVLGPALTVAPGTTTNYVVTPSNGAGVGATFSTTVYIGNGGGQTGSAPSNCSISQSPNTSATPVATGTTVTLSANCFAGSPVTSCAWGNGISSTSCSVNVSAPAATAAYSVVPSNSYGNGPTTIATVQVSNGGPAPGPFVNFCTGSDQIVNVNWPASGQVRPGTVGFGNQRIAFKITIPANFSPALNINHTGFMRTAEVPGAANTFREVTVSKNSCDFQSGDYLWNDIGLGDTGPSVSFSVNNPNGYQQTGSAFNVNSGDVIYFNIRNSFNGSPSCGSSSCDILFDFATPNRY